MGQSAGHGREAFPGSSLAPPGPGRTRQRNSASAARLRPWRRSLAGCLRLFFRELKEKLQELPTAVISDCVASGCLGAGKEWWSSAVLDEGSRLGFLSLLGANGCREKKPVFCRNSILFLAYVCVLNNGKCNLDR